MSLKRRNYLAWLLLALASLGWYFGIQLLRASPQYPISDTTVPAVWDTSAATYAEETSYRTTAPTANTEIAFYPTTIGMTAENYERPDTGTYRISRTFGFILCFAAIGCAAAGVFVLWQKKPLFGPDGTGLIAVALVLLRQLTDATLESLWILLFLLGIRELYGWLRARFSVEWCAAKRMADRYSKPQLALAVLAGWSALPLCGCCWFLFSGARYRYDAPLIAVLGFLTAAFFGVLCLWKYGKDLAHFQQQLERFGQGEPITVGDGALSETEARLLDVQRRHEEAVRSAVTSERFKVELISNVSHDLRTPLTSILGYSELLQQQQLSPEGQEQLRRLHQKAGYMNDLVESLFELTKVSSGVLESKQERIDLIRLLEQTVGLFDDQLTQAELFVRRSYVAESVPVVTDGARMHQVFANLLGNAIKYAMHGTRIYLEVKELEESYRVRMMNTASYEMDFQPDEILQRFARGDKARSTKGSGLGLAIAQTYTQSVGGTFRVSIDGDQFSAIVELPKK